MRYDKDCQALFQLALDKGLTTVSELAQLLKLINGSIAQNG